MNGGGNNGNQVQAFSKDTTTTANNNNTTNIFSLDGREFCSDSASMLNSELKRSFFNRINKVIELKVVVII